MNVRISSALTGAVAVVAATNAWAQAGQTISEVTVTGTVNTSQTVVLAAARLKPGSVFTNEAFEADRKSIRDLGLYASVSGRAEKTADGKLRVVYDVVENPVVSAIQIADNKAIPTAQILAQVRTQPKQVLNTVLLEQDLGRIQQMYAERGFRAFISERIGVDPATKILTIPIVETTVEGVRIEGNKKTKSYVFTREMRTKPGEAFNSGTLQRDVTNIYRLGLLEDINYKLEPGTEPGKVVVVVPVQERRTGNIGVGFGYSTRQRLVGNLELAETNFRGRGQSVNFRWEVGGIASRNSFEVGFAEPWIDKHNTSLGINLFDRVVYRFTRVLSTNATDGQNDDNYFERRRGGAATLSRPVSDATRGFLTFRTEAIKANNLQVNYNNLTSDEIIDIRGSLVQNGDVTAVTLRSATNTRDNELDPARGFYFSPSVEIGSSQFDYQKPRINPLWISDTATPGVQRILVDQRSQKGPFTKYNLDARTYLSLSGRRTTLTEAKRVLAGRLLFGTSTGSIGFSEQYFLGGAETLRGYPDDRFWGNQFVLASLELRLPFDNKGNVTGVLFSDIGDAWGATDANKENIKDFEQHSGFQPSVGLGLGVRLKTPVGPVRLDYGVGKQGGRTHFSIGQAF